MSSVELEPEATYHADYTHYSQSMLKHFAKSRREFHAYFVAKSRKLPEPSDDMRFGNCGHAALLEPHKLAELCVQVPAEVLNKDGHCKGSAYTAWEKQHEGKLLLNPERWNALIECTQAAHAILGDWIAAADHIEHVIRWRHEPSGLMCRMKADIIVEMTDHIYVPDLKFCRSASWDGFRKQAEDLRYWLQVATYTEGIRTIYPGNKPIVFEFAAVQSQWPHWATTHKIDDNSRQAAKMARDRLMCDLADCLTKDDWREPDEKEREPLVFRPWAFV